MSFWPSMCMCTCLVFLLLGLPSSISCQTNHYPEWIHDNKSDVPIYYTKGNTDALFRGKRLLLKNPMLHWPKGVVPFKYTRRLVDKYPLEIREISMAMAVYEHFTPIRFIPWTSTLHTDMGLGHQGFAIFTANVEASSCSSETGNQRNKNGQFINCCKRKLCMHEIGHLLGFHHEHQHQERDMWITVNRDAVANRLRQFMKLPPELFNYTKYDISSYMHYPPETSLSSNSKASFTYNWPDVKSIQRHFYMFKELCAVYKCHEYPQCSTFKVKCANEGYVSVVNDKCSCICPPGLDPALNCKATTKTVSTQYGMPRGRYGLLRKGIDCPLGPFQKMSLIKNDDDNHVCIRTKRDCYGKSRCGWPHGTYCFIKNGKCPTARGISGGKLHFLGSSNRIRFCCVENGFPEEATVFPTSVPFSLFMKHSKHCQQVIGMRAEQRSIEFLNTELINGPYSEGNDKKRNLFVCDYTPVDINCGSVYSLNKSKRSTITISIPTDRQKAANRDCTWLIKGPKLSTLILDFDEFEIKSDRTKCIDTVTVKHSRIGYAGIEYCGREVKHSIRSIYNKMLIRFQSGAHSTSHFRATVTLKTDTDMCYDPKDRGLSYGGNVSYTRRFEPCVLWKDATSCHHNTFQGGLPVNTLEGNYCRNPDNSIRPWCYTSVKGCKRNFCDVCHFEKLYDHADDCDLYDCTKDHLEVVSKCAATCQIARADFTPIVPHTKCSTPDQMRDGVLLSPKSSYSVGERVQYKCSLKNSDRVIDRICLSTGQWSIAKTACTECPLGFGPYKGNCYQYVDTLLTYDQAKDACHKLGAYLTTVLSEDENDHVSSLRLSSSSSSYLWLGGYYDTNKKTFVWEDGSRITWTHFSLSPPNPITKLSDMHFTLAYWKGWQRVDKKDKNPFVCKIDNFDNPTCEDYLDDCQGLLKNKENVDCNTAPDSGNLSPNLRNLCRYTCGLCLRGCGRKINIKKNETKVKFEAKTRNRECTWAINAPSKKGVLVLHFNKFDVESYPNGKCVDFVEVRTSNLGKIGTKYCGKEMKESIITHSDKMLVMYRSQKAKSHFKATVRWIPESKWCYKRDDKGFSYGGKVGHTQNFKRCVSWDLATKCRHHPYDSKDLLKNLEKNYCRNPDGSPEPWCYTDVDTCQREACDVCHWARPFDQSEFCSQSNCKNLTKTTVVSCARTCRKNIRMSIAKVFNVMCNPLKTRGPLQSVAKSSYNVGERLVFRCSINSTTFEELICLTSGQWTVYSTQCVDCPQGQAIFKGKCYKLMDNALYKIGAEERCNEINGRVAVAKIPEQNIFLASIREPDTRLWLGGKKAYGRGWKWDDGTPFKWTNWPKGGIEKDNLYNCVLMDFDTKWKKMPCYHSFYYACETEKKVSHQTSDIIATCSTLLPRKDMCSQYPHLANLCPHTCSDYVTD